MKQMRFTLALAGAAAALACAVPAAQANTLDQVMKSKVLRVAVDLNAPPYGMKDSSLNMTGSDVETARLIAKDLGVKLEIVPTTQANRIPFLLTNKADIVISSLSITPARQKVIDFTIPYAAIQAVIAAPKSMAIDSMKDLAGKTVVTARGTTNDNEVTRLAPPGTNIVRFENDATAITAITSGQASIYAGAPALVATLDKKDPAKALVIKIVMSSAMMGFGVNKGNTALEQKLDALIRQDLKNGKLNAIYKKFHGADLPKEVLAEGNGA